MHQHFSILFFPIIFCTPHQKAVQCLQICTWFLLLITPWRTLNVRRLACWTLITQIRLTSFWSLIGFTFGYLWVLVCKELLFEFKRGTSLKSKSVAKMSFRSVKGSIVSIIHILYTISLDFNKKIIPSYRRLPIYNEFFYSNFMIFPISSVDYTKSQLFFKQVDLWVNLYFKL